MELKEGIYTFLQSKTLITDLVSDRVYPQEAPQGVTAPYITYEIQEGVSNKHLRGASEASELVAIFTVHAATTVSRSSVKEALRNILHGRVRYTMTDSTGSIYVKSSFMQGAPEDYDDPPDGSETGGRFKCDMSFLVQFGETLPTLP